MKYTPWQMEKWRYKTVPIEKGDSSRNRLFACLMLNTQQVAVWQVLYKGIVAERRARVKSDGQALIDNFYSINLSFVGHYTLGSIAIYSITDFNLIVLFFRAG